MDGENTHKTNFEKPAIQAFIAQYLCTSKTAHFILFPATSLHARLKNCLAIVQLYIKQKQTKVY